MTMSGAREHPKAASLPPPVADVEVRTRVASLAVLIVGQGISTGGSSMSNVAFVWLIVQMTGSAASLGLVMTAIIVPNIALRLWGGVLTDRVGPRTLLVVSDILRAMVMLILAALALDEQITIYSLVISALILGTCQAVFDPALRAAVPSISNPDSLLRINSWLDMTNRTAGLLFPAAAGVMAATVGLWSLLAIDGISFLASALSIIAIRLPRASVSTRKGVWGQLRDGLSYVGRTPYLRSLILAAALINLADALVVVYPLYIANVLGLGVAWYGLFNSAVMAGLLTATVTYLITGRRVPLQPALVSGSIVQGSGLLLVVLSQNRFAGLGGFFAFGLGMGLFGTACVTLLQRGVDKGLLGRVMGLYGTVALGLMPVGYAIASYVASEVGPGPVMATGGVVMLLVGVGLGIGHTTRVVAPPAPATDSVASGSVS